MGRRKENKGILISYKLNQSDLEKLDHYARQLHSSRSKFVIYLIYSMVMNNKYTPKILANYWRIKHNQHSTKNINVYIPLEVKREIDRVRNQLSEEGHIHYHRNYFIGSLIQHQLHEIERFCKDLNNETKQVAIYLENSLYTEVMTHIQKYRLSFQMLLFDCLKDFPREPREGFPPLLTKNPQRQERIITLLPKRLYEKIKNSPVQLTTLASVELARHLERLRTGESL
jgi:hypothetical protein